MRIKCEDKSVVFKYVFLVPFGLCLIERVGCSRNIRFKGGTFAKCSINHRAINIYIYIYIYIQLQTWYIIINLSSLIISSSLLRFVFFFRTRDLLGSSPANRTTVKARKSTESKS